MVWMKRHTQRFSRLMAGLFAVQVIVAGFCLMPVKAHASSMPQMAAPMPQMTSAHAGMATDHCASMAAEHAHNSQHRAPCVHCDQPDAMAQAFAAIDHADLPLLPVLAFADSAQLVPAEQGLLSARVATGPPRSSSLIYTTTQRIRI